jgi:hypothetical protein
MVVAEFVFCSFFCVAGAIATVSSASTMADYSRFCPAAVGEPLGAVDTPALLLDMP